MFRARQAVSFDSLLTRWLWFIRFRCFVVNFHSFHFSTFSCLGCYQDDWNKVLKMILFWNRETQRYCFCISTLIITNQCSCQVWGQGSIGIIDKDNQEHIFHWWGRLFFVIGSAVCKNSWRQHTGDREIRWGTQQICDYWWVREVGEDIGWTSENY